ncbi:hypothetical protein DPMN_102564 [Dreissena polymorpha]|uniref:Uncharacterized protein n=1 Tax=Dreissena polymorpha TaxID=45954 RepID=A0A9D4R976_DREPO|nr:hypothetical protein DPMN_102564 [Dreissena polymorpha]
MKILSISGNLIATLVHNPLNRCDVHGNSYADLSGTGTFLGQNCTQVLESG